MASIGQSFRHNLANLTRVEGRDSTGQYWPYVLTIIVVNFIISLILTVPMMIDAFTASFEAVRQGAEAGVPVDDTALQAQMMQQMMGDIAGFWPITMALGIVQMLLVLAATVRRLHDRDWSGWWVLLGVVGWLTGAIASWWTMDLMQGGIAELEANMGMISVIGWLPYVGYIILLIQLVQSGSPEPNRFGPPPLG